VKSPRILHWRRWWEHEEPCVYQTGCVQQWPLVIKFWLWEPVSGPGSDYVVLKNAKGPQIVLWAWSTEVTVALTSCWAFAKRQSRSEMDNELCPVYGGRTVRRPSTSRILTTLCVGVEGGATTRAQLKQNKCNIHARDQAWYSYSFPDDDNRV